MTPDTTPAATVQLVPQRTTDDIGQALLDAAHQLLATEGPEALTVRRIAQQAGTSTMNVYSRFGGKDGVIERLFIDGFARLAASMDGTQVTDNPLEDLRACGRRYRAFGLANPTYYSIMFDQAVAEFTPSDSAQEFALSTLGRVTSNVQRAIDAGQIYADDAQIVAIGLWAAGHGLLSLEVRNRDHLPFDWQAVYEFTTERLLAGYASPPR